MADLTITAANVGIKGDNVTLIQVQAGEALTQMQPVYQKTSDGKYYQSDANVDDETAEAVGVTLTSAAADEYVVVATAGDVDPGTTVVATEEYVVSDTAGKLMPIGDLSSGDRYTRIGYGKDTSTIAIDVLATGIQKA